MRDFVDVELDSRGLPGFTDFSLVSSYPKREFGAGDAGITLKTAGLAPQAVLYIKDNEA